ncbi:hypothetical protein C1645_744158 [Glomus cerebriforme]|uniref:HMG box domain-containing protein n=1 Tax=Glomus cerebriforme TaxID=658196 RepID=A0A397SHH3_9GLOM|nr:hypothetical protein C1645_744158 [Glomus cerebriforme]
MLSNTHLRKVQIYPKPSSSKVIKKSQLICPNILPPPQKKKKPLNGYMIFFLLFHKTLKEQYPHLNSKQQAVKAGEIWRSFSNDLKNSFIEFANDERILSEMRDKIDLRKEYIHYIRNIPNPSERKGSKLTVIVDDLSPTSKKSELLKRENNRNNRLQNPPPSLSEPIFSSPNPSLLEEELFHKLFNELINYN